MCARRGGEREVEGGIQEGRVRVVARAVALRDGLQRRNEGGLSGAARAAEGAYAEGERAGRLIIWDGSCACAGRSLSTQCRATSTAHAQGVYAINDHRALH